MDYRVLGPVQVAATGVSRVAHSLGDYERMQGFAEASLDLFRTLDDERGTALSLNHLGIALSNLGDIDGGIVCHEENAAISRRIGDGLRLASALNNLGYCRLRRGQYAEARALFEDGLEVSRESGHRTGESVMLGNLGLAAASACFTAEAQAAGSISFGEQGTKGALGANGIVRIDGTITYRDDCPVPGVKDFFYPATDVYLVPAGTGSGTGKLHDVGGGRPNTIVSGASRVTDEVIAMTASAGFRAAVVTVGVGAGRGAPTPRTRCTARCRASPAGERARSPRRSCRRSRRCPRRAWRSHARCGSGPPRASGRRRCRSVG